MDKMRYFHEEPSLLFPDEMRYFHEEPSLLFLLSDCGGNGLALDFSAKSAYA
jgi:hypothetical protein